MNGRVYDYNVGRFMSVDPVIHGNGNSQGVNPYSYILNNPLSGTDPTGYNPKVETVDYNPEKHNILKDEDGNYFLDTGGENVIAISSVETAYKSGASSTKTFGDNGKVTGVSNTSASGATVSVADIGSQSSLSISYNKKGREGESLDGKGVVTKSGLGGKTLFDELKNRKEIVSFLKEEILDTNDLPEDLINSIRKTRYKCVDGNSVDGDLLWEFGSTDPEKMLVLIGALHWDKNFNLDYKELVDTFFHESLHILNPKLRHSESFNKKVKEYKDIFFKSQDRKLQEREAIKNSDSNGKGPENIPR